MKHKFTDDPYVKTAAILSLGIWIMPGIGAVPLATYLGYQLLRPVGRGMKKLASWRPRPKPVPYRPTAQSASLPAPPPEKTLQQKLEDTRRNFAALKFDARNEPDEEFREIRVAQLEFQERKAIKRLEDNAAMI